MITFACPSCGHQVSCPDHFAGKRGKCPRCRSSVSVPSSSNLPAVAADLEAEAIAAEVLLPVPVDSPPPPTLPIDVEVLARQVACPFCAEPILPAAKKCKHCGETLDVTLRAAEESRRLLELTAAQKPPVQHVHVVNNVESRSEAKATATAWSDGGCGSGCGGLILIFLVLWLFSAMCAPDRNQPPPAPPPPAPAQTSIKPFVPVPHPLPIPELPERVTVCKRGIAATAALLTELGTARVEENAPETLAALRRRISDERERIDRDTNYARDRPELRAEVRLRQAAAQLVSASLDDVKQLRIVSKLDALVAEDLKAATAEVKSLEASLR